MLHFNIRVAILKEELGDDGYGGVTVTGTTVLYPSEPSRLDSYMPSVSLTKQLGIETEQIYTYFLHVNRQHPIVIRENQVIEIIFPLEHPEYGNRFRIRGISPEAAHPGDSRGIIECTCTRIKYSRTADSI